MMYISDVYDMCKPKNIKSKIEHKKLFLKSHFMFFWHLQRLYVSNFSSTYNISLKRTERYEPKLNQ